MQLKDQEVKVVLKFILQQGGSNFLKLLCVGRVLHRTGKEKCPVCKSKTVGAHGKAWMIVNTSGSPVFDDRFHDDNCARIAIRWLCSILISYKEYLGPKECSETETLEDEVRDYFPMKDEESLRAFALRFKSHLEDLQEITPQIDEEIERIEDHF